MCNFNFKTHSDFICDFLHTKVSSRKAAERLSVWHDVTKEISGIKKLRNSDLDAYGTLGIVSGTVLLSNGP